MTTGSVMGAHRYYLPPQKVMELTAYPPMLMAQTALWTPLIITSQQTPQAGEMDGFHGLRASG